MTAVVVFLVLALAWVLVSGRLESLSVTAPIVAGRLDHRRRADTR